MKKVIGVTLLTLAAATQTAHAEPKKLPTIVSDECAMRVDKQGWRWCFVKTSDGKIKYYWQRNGKVRWSQPKRRHNG